MLEPRPEIRMATRLRTMPLAFMTALKAEPAGVGHARLALFCCDDLAKRYDAFAMPLEHGSDLGRRARFDHGDHADPAVEGAQHFLFRNPAGLGEPSEHRRHRDAADVDARAEFLRQHTRD